MTILTTNPDNTDRNVTKTPVGTTADDTSTTTTTNCSDDNSTLEDVESIMAPQQTQFDDNLSCAAKVPGRFSTNCLPPSRSSDRSISHDSFRSQQSFSSNSGRRQYKRVRFSTIEIRDYDVCVGDNPSVTGGVPISLSWTHCNTFLCPVNEYERNRKEQRRPQSKLKISEADRIDLLSGFGVSEVDIRAGKRDARRSQVRRKWTQKTLSLEPMHVCLEYSMRAVANSTVRRWARRKEKAALLGISKSKVGQQI